MATITDLARPATIEGPQDPELARLWALALAKFESTEGRQPATRADWRQITMEYGRLISKPRGTLTHIIAERCAEVRDGD